MTERRLHIQVSGIVQGVGFRPFVFCCARDLGLSGWVRNTPAGVEVELQGESAALDRFRHALEHDAPPLAVITSVTDQELPPGPCAGFTILPSAGGERSVQIAPDCAVCPDCLRELFDPADRRYRHPFITCTNCGPRYSIVTGIPYDRPLTTMAPFPLCDACRAEYGDPADRRFHAQPVACPDCGPRLSLTLMDGTSLTGDQVESAAALLQAGKILAVKGIGGYHLATDACNGSAVAELRRRKKRDEKPFAVMVPDLATVHRLAHCDRTAEKLLTGPESPIVLLRRRDGIPVVDGVAPGSGYLGIMLPYAPLHHLLVRGRFTALVMTSGNLSDEPVVCRDDDARRRLAGIADAVLCHDREIHAKSDDSVLRVFRGEPLFIRRARGYVPRPVRLPGVQPQVLAVGGELKGAVCLTRGADAFLSPHIGDLQNAATFDAFRETIDHLASILEIRPQVCAHDLHPDYLSTGYATELALPGIAVQHHHAHMASCMAEHRLEGEVIGVIFDGTGLGPDGTVWGGEFLSGGYTGFRRLGHFRQVPLPGGDAAVREPYRMALAHLFELYGAALFDLPLPVLETVPAGDRPLFLTMLERRLNAPLTSSCGRLFDGVASLLGLRTTVSHDAQAAMELEALAEGGNPELPPYPFEIVEENGCRVIDFRPAIQRVVDALLAGLATADIARRFHGTVALASAELCRRIGDDTGLNRVVLSGGAFQNRLLAEGVCELLEARGFQVFTHRLVPPNDGGLALGQAVIAGRTWKGDSQGYSGFKKHVTG